LAHESTPRSEFFALTAKLEALTANLLPFDVYNSDVEKLRLSVSELQVVTQNAVSIEKYLSLVSVVNKLREQLTRDIHLLREQQNDIAHVMNQELINNTEKLNRQRHNIIHEINAIVMCAYTSSCLHNYVPGKKEQIKIDHGNCNVFKCLFRPTLAINNALTLLKGTKHSENCNNASPT
jgi:hypothetical protein